MPDLFEKFRAGLPYIDFIDRHANEAQKQRWQRVHEQVSLTGAAYFGLPSFGGRAFSVVSHSDNAASHR